MRYCKFCGVEIAHKDCVNVAGNPPCANECNLHFALNVYYSIEMGFEKPANTHNKRFARWLLTLSHKKMALIYQAFWEGKNYEGRKK